MLIEQIAEANPTAEDLDRHLAARGVSAAEMARILSHPCLAGLVAAAAAPFLAECPERGALIQAIAAQGTDTVRKALAARYAAILTGAPPVEAPPELTVEAFVEAYLAGDIAEGAVQFVAGNAEAVEAEFARREAEMPLGLARLVKRAKGK